MSALLENQVVISVLGMLRQEDLKFNTSLGYTGKTLSQKHTEYKATNIKPCSVPSLELKTGRLDLNATYRDEQVNSNADLHSGGRKNANGKTLLQ